MLSAREFIKPTTQVGVVEFNDIAYKRLDIAEFDLNQQARYAAIAEDLSPGGGTAMYDGIVLGLKMLEDQRALDPELKPILVVLSDGETTDGLTFDDVDSVIEGLRIPIYTVGFEADLDELGSGVVARRGGEHRRRCRGRGVQDRRTVQRRRLVREAVADLARGRRRRLRRLRADHVGRARHHAGVRGGRLVVPDASGVARRASSNSIGSTTRNTPSSRSPRRSRG